CRRGFDSAWPQAELARQRGAKETTDQSQPPGDFTAVAERLGRVAPAISHGNPAKTTPATPGPPYPPPRRAHTRVADEMSLWDGRPCAPPALHRLARGEPFNGFCSAVIKALEAANARYGTLVALGLSPRDWQDLSVNTAKKLSTFLGAARGKGADGAEAS